MNSRAAVFTSSPQSVEVYQAGTWWQGELLGWRHEASGACRMWVRVVVGSVEEVEWVDLAALRLPEHTPSPVIDPSTAEPGRIDSRARQELPTSQVVSALRGRPLSSDPVTTAALPMIRDEAPSVSAVAAVAPTLPVARPGGRRRAPEDADVQVVDASAVSPGRHRAPRDEGRHRAADTETFGAVTGDEPTGAAAEAAPVVDSRRPGRGHTGAGWSVPAARSARPEESHARPEVCTGRIDAEPDLLTRPMRLGDLTGGSRRPRLSGSRSGA